MSRQQRRQRERELSKLAAEVRRGGLPVPHRPEGTMALALAVRDGLRDSKAATRAAEAAALIDRVFDLTLARLPVAERAPPVACTMGCTFCCHNEVMATAPEVFLAANALRTRNDPAFAGTVRTRCSTVRPARESGGRPPCPLLEEARCSVYAARPAVCRKHNSFAVDACRDEHEGRPGRIPVRSFDQKTFECCAVALLTGMRLWDGRRGRVYEFSAALAVALENPGAEAGWLAGADVFAGVPDQSELPGIDEHAAFIWARFTDNA